MCESMNQFVPRDCAVVVKVGDTPVTTFEDMATAVRKMHGSVPIVVQRDGKTITTNVTVESTRRYVPSGQGDKLEPANVGAIGVDRHVTPTNQCLAFLGDDIADNLFAMCQLIFIGWQKNIADGVFTRLGKFSTQFFTGDLLEEAVRQRHQDAGTITGVGFKATATAVIHA